MKVNPDKFHLIFSDRNRQLVDVCNEKISSTCSEKLFGIKTDKAYFSIVCSYHVTYVFQSESILYSYLNAKELLARNRREIWSLSDFNWSRTHNHLVHERTLNHLTKLAKWMNCVVSIYLYVVFGCVFLSCHVRV